MVFSSFLFIFLFLPLIGGVYLVTPKRLKNSTLLVASIFFYGWGAPQVLPFLLAGCLFDFLVSPWLVPDRISLKQRKLLFAVSVAVNLSALLYYKYFNFAAAEINRIFQSVGVVPLHWSQVVLPIGISFFTFHKISYLGDIYRGKVTPARSVTDYCLYILFFPQLVAGPIIRYADVAQQFTLRTHSVENVFFGLTRFCTGLAKKVLIADSLGAVVDGVFALNSSKLSPGSVWVAVTCYSFQIFFDFSGYSDMAIGLARVFGFRFKENFNQPYRAASFTDFWRRWHISLSTFMREYLYIPLGGNRGTFVRTQINLWITFLLSGLWHGASWNFVVWGAFHGAFLTFDRLGWENLSGRLPKWSRITLTFFLVSIGWVFFRAESLEQAFQFLSVMFGIESASNPAIPRALLIDNRTIFMLLIAVLLSFVPRSIVTTVGDCKAAVNRYAIVGAQASIALAVFGLSVAALASRGYTPFLYFRF